MDGASFLETVAGVARSGLPMAGARIATIDATYDPYGSPYPAGRPPLPKVTFDGEDVLSGRQYAYLNGYVPCPGDRVLMLPVGNTFIIMGKVSAVRQQGILQSPDGTGIDFEFGDGSYYNSGIGLILYTPVFAADGTSWTDMSMPASWTGVCRFRPVASPPYSIHLDIEAAHNGATHSNGTLLATLPAGYRPTYDYNFEGAAGQIEGSTGQSPHLFIQKASHATNPGKIFLYGFGNSSYVSAHGVLALD